MSPTDSIGRRAIISSGMKPSPLFRAVKYSDAMAVRRLLASGADPNDSSSGEAVLWKAAGSGNVTILRLLLDAGAKVDAGFESGHTALVSAVLMNHVNAVRLLLVAGASPSVKPDGFPLLNWIEWAGGRHTPSSRIAIVKLLRQTGAKRRPYWWLNRSWRARYWWTSLLRRFGIRRGIGPPPWAPRIPLPPPKEGR